MSSEGKVAVVTGGGAGIGKACVLRFVKEEMRVVFGDMSPEDGEKTCAMARDAGGDVLFCEGNVVNELDCQAWGQAALDAWGYIDFWWRMRGPALQEAFWTPQRKIGTRSLM